MNIENIENIEITKGEITEEELEGIYMYLSLYFEQMTKEEKIAWTELMKTIDPEFNDIADD